MCSEWGILRAGCGCLLPSPRMGLVPGTHMVDERRMDSSKLSSDPYSLPANQPTNHLINQRNYQNSKHYFLPH